nr:motile sperm domain-containing protein 3-like [Rhipicephalus microplus]
MRYDGEAGRFHDGASGEGIPEYKDAERDLDPYMSVSASPSQPNVYIDVQGGDTQVLTLFNVSEHSVYFELISSAANRCSVTWRSEIITPHCYTEIVLQYFYWSEENVGTRDKLRIVMREQGGHILGFRDVVVNLWSNSSRSDDQSEVEYEEYILQIGSSPAQSLPQQGRSEDWALSVLRPLLLFLVVASVVVLLLPLEGAYSASHEAKLFAAYVLGFLTQLIICCMGNLCPTEQP